MKEFKGTQGKWRINEEMGIIVTEAEMLEMLRKLYAEDLLKDNADDVLKLIREATF